MSLLVLIDVLTLLFRQTFFCFTWVIDINNYFPTDGTSRADETCWVNKRVLSTLPQLETCFGSHSPLQVCFFTYLVWIWIVFHGSLVMSAGDWNYTQVEFLTLCTSSDLKSPNCWYQWHQAIKQLLLKHPGGVSWRPVPRRETIPRRVFQFKNMLYMRIDLDVFSSNCWCSDLYRPCFSNCPMVRTTVLMVLSLGAADISKFRSLLAWFSGSSCFRSFAQVDLCFEAWTFLSHGHDSQRGSDER